MTFRVLLSSVRYGFFDQSCNLLWPGDVDRVAGAGDFDLVAVGARGIPAFEIGVNVLSAPATSIQVGLLFHAAVVITALKLSAKLGTCDRAMVATARMSRKAPDQSPGCILRSKT